MQLPSVRVVTDSIADVPPDLAQELGITIVPALITFGTEVFHEGVDLSRDELYRRLVAGPGLPSTGSPGPGVFAEAYQRLIDEQQAAGNPLQGIVSIHAPVGLSALYNAAWVGSQSVAAPIKVIDSGSVSLGMGLVAVETARLAQRGASFEEAAAFAAAASHRNTLAAVLDTLEYAARSGRVNRIVSIAGGVLAVKPIITIKGGVLDLAERVRTRSRAFEHLVEYAAAAAPFDALAVVHAHAPEMAAQLLERVSAYHQREQIVVAEAGVVLASYGGPGAFAVCFIRKAG